MVLNHIPQSAYLVIKFNPAAHTKILRHRDLYVVDIAAVPKWFEHGIGETQGEQILNRLLSEVVVDPEYAVFWKALTHPVIDFKRRGMVVSYRLLQHDTHVVIDQLVVFETGCNSTK